MTPKKLTIVVAGSNCRHWGPKRVLCSDKSMGVTTHWLQGWLLSRQYPVYIIDASELTLVL